MEVPPTSLRIHEYYWPHDSRSWALLVWEPAVMQRLRVVVVNDEVVSGDNLAAAACILGLTTIYVHVHHGEPDYWRMVYDANGATDGVAEKFSD